MNTMNCLAVLALFASIFVSDISAFGANPRPEQDEETSRAEYKVGDNVKVVVDTFNGPVEVKTGTDAVVKVEVVKWAKGETKAEVAALLRSIRVTIGEDRGTVNVTAVCDETVRGQRRASVCVTVPSAAVADLNTANGAIKVNGLKGGELTAKTQNGQIAISRCDELRVESHANNGSVEFTEVSGLKKVKASVGNGHVQFDGTLAPGDHSFITMNGRVTVRLPSDANFALDASTGNGTVEVGFAFSDVNRKSSTRVTGNVGSKPQTRLRVSTGNGAITVGKAK